MSKILRKKIFFFICILVVSILVYMLRLNKRYSAFVNLSFINNWHGLKNGKKEGEIKVRITGMIKYPGTYTVSRGSRLNYLIRLAGGLRRYAYRYLPYKIILKDSEEYYIPFRKLKRGEAVNINAADILELCTIPYINKKRAEVLVDYRSKYGRFDEKEEIMEIEGIGKKRYESIKNFIEIGEKNYGK